MKNNSDRREGGDDKSFKENFDTIDWSNVKRVRRITHSSHGSSPTTVNQFEEFKSPLDGSVIGDRRQLREHNNKHGVTDSRDYSADYMKKRETQRFDQMTGNTKQDQQERVNTIKRAMNKD
tara:strand:+ start:3156 stop:3518 length:363 start_codon:yes stop_codon:yes gene_type:complete